MSYLRLLKPVELPSTDAMPMPMPSLEVDIEDGNGRFKRSVGRIQITAEPPPDRNWSLYGILLAQAVTVLAGLGGVSKTMLAILWAVHVAIGRKFADRRAEPGAVVMFLGEETPEEVHRRVNAVVIALGLTDIEKTLVQARLLIFGSAGQDIRLTTLAGGDPVATGVGEDMVQICDEHAFACGTPIRLVCIDHAKLVMAGDGNAAADVTALTRELTHIARMTESAVLLLAHSPKASVGNDGKSSVKDVAGNAALVDNARVALALRAMREDEAKKYGIAPENHGSYALLENFKNNYAATGDVAWLVRRTVDSHAIAVPLEVSLDPVTPATKRASTLEGQLIAFVGAHRGQFSKTGLRDSQSGKDGPLKASKGQVAATLETLIADGRLLVRPPSASEREKYGLGPRVTHVLDTAANS